MIEAILLLVCAPYAAVAVGYLEARRRGERPPTWARWVGLATVSLHLVAMIAVGRVTGRSPFQTEDQALSFLAFAVAALYVVLERTSGVATYGGGFHLLTAVLAAASVPGLARAGTLVRSAREPDVQFSLHVGFALLGTAAVVSGGLLAVGYLGAYRRMKALDVALEATPGPSLSGLQRLARDTSFAGVALLAPALGLGWAVLARGDHRDAWTAAELALASVEWALALVAGLVWWRRPMRGASAAWLNVVATVLAVLAFAIVHPHVAAGGR